MELLGKTGRVRTTPLTRSILDYMTKDENQDDTYIQSDPFKS
jgi:hypothetical protein